MSNIESLGLCVDVTYSDLKGLGVRSALCAEGEVRVQADFPHRFAGGREILGLLADMAITAADKGCRWMVVALRDGAALPEKSFGAQGPALDVRGHLNNRIRDHVEADFDIVVVDRDVLAAFAVAATFQERRYNAVAVLTVSDYLGMAMVRKDKNQPDVFRPHTLNDYAVYHVRHLILEDEAVISPSKGAMQLLEPDNTILFSFSGSTLPEKRGLRPNEVGGNNPIWVRLGQLG